MFSSANFRKAIRDPGLMAVFVRFWFPWTALRKDRECHHMVRAWTSGRLPRIPLGKLFPGIAAGDVLIRKAEARAIGWSLDFQELVHLLSIVKLTRPRRVLEIGTYDGYTTLNVAANLSPDGEVHTLDLPQDLDQTALRSGGISNACVSGVIGSQFRGEPEAGKIRQHWADSSRVDWATLGAPFDLVLIDGCHDDPYVGIDSANALKHVNPGGTILWHDYGQCLDVSRAVDELSRTRPIHALLGTRFACLRVPG